MLSAGAASQSAVPPPRLSLTPSVTPSARSADFGAENAELREKVQKLRRLLRCANDEIGRLRGGTAEAGAEATPDMKEAALGEEPRVRVGDPRHRRDLALREAPPTQPGLQRRMRLEVKV